jgi:hypothetical protein
VDRALRLLAVAALLGFGAYVACFLALRTASVLLLGDLATAQIYLAFISQTAYSLGFAAGVVALVACVQRRQRWWGVGVVCLLLLTVYGIVLTYSLRSALGVLIQTLAYPVGYVYIIQEVPAALLALLVLIYSFIAHRSRPVAIGSATAG